MTSHFPSILRGLAAGASIVSLAGSALHADTVWTIASGAGAKPFERSKLKIEGLTASGLLFRSVSQDRVAEPKPLKEIWRIQVDDEVALNAAETAYVAEKWDEAVSGYQRTLATTRKDWVKQYATVRLVTAAEKSGKFAASASAYIALVTRSPNAAAEAKPTVPKNAKAEVTTAITAVKVALGDTRLPAAQKNALQAFLAELYIANGQPKEAESLGTKPGNTVNAVPAPPPAGKTEDRISAPAPAADKGKVDLQLQLAVAAIKQKKFQDAIDAINSIAPSLNDPQQQASALFTLAEAKAGLADKDVVKLKDAALAYMRVVAHFKSQPDAPHVAESLFKSGVMLEQAKLLPDALAAYKSVETDFKDSPHAKEAAAGAARVQKAIEEAKG
jgi:TolA-binding protein